MKFIFHLYVGDKKEYKESDDSKNKLSSTRVKEMIREMYGSGYFSSNQAKNIVKNMFDGFFDLIAFEIFIAKYQFLLFPSLLFQKNLRLAFGKNCGEKFWNERVLRRDNWSESTFNSAINLMRKVQERYKFYMIITKTEPSKYFKSLRKRRLSSIKEGNSRSEKSSVYVSERCSIRSTASELDHIDYCSTLGLVPIYEEELIESEGTGAKNVEELLSAIKVVQKEEDDVRNVLLLPNLNSVSEYFRKSSEKNLLNIIKNKPIKNGIPKINFHNFNHNSRRIGDVSAMRNQRKS